MIPNPLPPRSERGQTMVLIVLSILGLIAIITGLAVDGGTSRPCAGWMWTSRGTWPSR